MIGTSSVQHDVVAAIKFMEDRKNKNEYEYVMLFKDMFVRDNFPNDFDGWTVKKQYTWINQNIAQFFPNVPESLQNLIPGNFCPINNDDQPLEKLPEWMDMKKYRKGQKFVQTHYIALIISKLMGMIYIYSFDEDLKTLILGNSVHTLYLGFKRYLSTFKRIFNWYSGDPWIKGTKAYKDMQVTRFKHIVIREKEYQMDNEQIAAACTFANPWCPDRELLLKDFAMACPSEKLGQRPYTIMRKSEIYKPKAINNTVFAYSQTMYIVLPLLNPEKIGIYDATDEDLEAFCHMWKCYGSFLGIEDEYNFCRGSLDEIKQRMRDFYQYWVIPNFKELSSEWEHISRCIVVPLNYYPFIYIPFKVMILMSMEALNLNMPHLYKSLNYTEWIVYQIYKLLRYGMKFTSVRFVVNKIMHKIIMMKSLLFCSATFNTNY